MDSTNYIYLYYQQIKEGSVTVGSYIRQAYEWIIRGLEEHQFFYNHKAAMKAISFIENFCRHHEGVLAPQKIKLEVWQKAFLSCVFGIVNENGSRQFSEVILVIGRKNGKTLLAAAISAYCAFLDGEYGARVYMAAPKLEQAKLCYNAFHQMVEKEPTLKALIKKRKSDIYIAESNSSIAPLPFAEKSSDGLNISTCIADEIASWRGEAGLKFYEVLKSSFGSRKQPLLLSISTAGYENEGIFDELMRRATRVLDGGSEEKKLLPILYIIDDSSKWNDINELRKSNPNIGVSITIDYLLGEIAIAENSLSKKVEVLTKYCNIKQNSSAAWLPTKAINLMSGDALDLNDFRNTYCVGGIDLSRTTDLTACCVVIEKNGELYVFSKFFLPREKIDEATARDNLPYNIYIKRGLLQASGDNFVDYTDCFNWFRELVERYSILPLQVGYDRYSAQYLVNDMKSYGFHMDDVYQGNNLTPVIREFEGLAKDGKVHIGDNDLLKVHLLNTALKIETEQEKCRIVKMSQNSHIDGCASLLDAFCVRQKWASDIGVQLQNKEVS